MNNRRCQKYSLFNQGNVKVDSKPIEFKYFIRKSNYLCELSQLLVYMAEPSDIADSG